MKFTCPQSTLQHALNVAVRAVNSAAASRRAALAAVLMNVEGQTLTITGTDLDTTIEVKLDVGPNHYMEGKAAPPARLFHDVVKSLGSGAVTFDASEPGEAHIKGGGAEFNLRLVPADDFPDLPSQSQDDQHPYSAPTTIGGADLSAALNKVVGAASSDDSRPILTGVNFEVEGDVLRLAATDSYRLAVCGIEHASLLGDRQKVLLPGPALKELQRLLDDDESVTVRFSDIRAEFTVDNVTLATRLIPGDFPNYKGLIPEDDQPNRLVVDRKVFLGVLQRMRLLAQESSPVRLRMSPDSVEVIAITQDVGKANEVLPAEYTGEDLLVAFNPTYLIGGLETLTGDKMALGTTDGVKPALMRSVPEDDEPADDSLYLLMPVRVA